MKIDFNNKPKPHANFASFESIINHENIQRINIDDLVPFKDQPFKPYTADKLKRLTDDISQNGMLSPIIVRPINEGKYQILSGHNRANAAKAAGLTEVPSIIKNCDDRLAKLIMVNSNLNQRDELLPSEKAFAYKIQVENSTVTAVAADNDISRKEIQRYLRLTHLIPELLDMLDDSCITLTAGVNLSYLSEANQIELYEFIKAYRYKITTKMSERLKGEFGETQFSEEFLLSIFKHKKIQNERSNTNIAFQADELNKYFSGKTADEIKSEILRILESVFMS